MSDNGDLYHWWVALQCWAAQNAEFISSNFAFHLSVKENELLTKHGKWDLTDKIEVQGRWIGCKETLAYLQRMDPRLLMQMGYKRIVIFEPMCLVLIKTV